VKKRTGISQRGSLIKRYSSGAEKNTIPDAASSFLRPNWSDSTPTGNENRIPASGETADTRPITTSFAPIACEKLPAKNETVRDFLKDLLKKSQRNPRGTGNTSYGGPE